MSRSAPTACLALWCATALWVLCINACGTQAASASWINPFGATVLNNGQPPPPRAGASAVTFPRSPLSTEIVIFGGQLENGQETSDVAILGAELRKWEGSSVATFVDVGAGALRPLAVSRHAAVAVRDVNTSKWEMFTFGGRKQNNTDFASCSEPGAGFSRFDLHTRQWLPLLNATASGGLTAFGPPALAGHSAVTFDQVGGGEIKSAVIVLFGGDRGIKVSDSTFVLDLSSHSWANVSIVGLPPTPRWGHSAVASGNHMVVFGGINEGGALNDVMLLDVRSWSWSASLYAGSPPQARHSHCAVLFDRTMVILFGRNVRALTDVAFAEINDTTTLWIPVDVLGVAPEARFVSACSQHSELVFAFSGSATLTTLASSTVGLDVSVRNATLSTTTAVDSSITSIGSLTTSELTTSTPNPPVGSEKDEGTPSALTPLALVILSAAGLIALCCVLACCYLSLRSRDGADTNPRVLNRTSSVVLDRSSARISRQNSTLMLSSPSTRADKRNVGSGSSTPLSEMSPGVRSPRSPSLPYRSASFELVTAQRNKRVVQHSVYSSYDEDDLSRAEKIGRESDSSSDCSSSYYSVSTSERASKFERAATDALRATEFSSATDIETSSQSSAGNPFATRK